MTEPAEFGPETPRVTLGGRQWPIPDLVWRDLKRCRKELLELQDRINLAIASAAQPSEGSADERASRNMLAMAEVFQDLSNEDFDRLVMGPLHVGLAAAHPSLAREELESWPMTEFERQLAWLVVRRQSGLFVMREAPTDEVAAEEDSGEGVGAA